MITLRRLRRLTVLLAAAAAFGASPALAHDRDPDAEIFATA